VSEVYKQTHDSAGNEYGKLEPGSLNVKKGEYHPAKRAPNHRLSQTAEYRSWAAMMRRVNDPRHKDYRHYGGRGIRVCERWSDFLSFLEDMGARPPHTTLDRINNDGQYESSNCQWSDKSIQNRNRRPLNNHTTGVSGITLFRNGKWRVYIKHNGKQVHLGYFAKLEDAILARKEGEKRVWI
jgi:hypothetical protein